MRSIKENEMRETMFHRHDGAESVEIILLKEPSSPTTTVGLVLLEDPIRLFKGTYHLVTLSSSEDTEDAEDELVGLQYLSEDE